MNILKTHTENLLIKNKFEFQSFATCPLTFLSKNFIRNT